MSKMSELSQVLDELTRCGEALIKTAATIREIFTETSQENISKPPTGPKEVKGSTKGQNPANTVQQKEEPAPAPTIKKEEVRAVLAAKSSAGLKDEVKALLGKYGATQLKQVKPEDYSALIKEAEMLKKPEVSGHA